MNTHEPFLSMIEGMITKTGQELSDLNERAEAKRRELDSLITLSVRYVDTPAEGSNLLTRCKMNAADVVSRNDLRDALDMALSTLRKSKPCKAERDTTLEILDDTLSPKPYGE